MNSIYGQNAVSLLLGNHQQIHDNIKFADQKALVFIVFNTGLISALWPMIKSNEATSLLGGFAVCAVLAVAVGVFIWVIRPRGAQNRGRGVGLIDAERIAQYRSCTAFLTALSSATDPELIAELQTLLYDRSCIDRAKYRAIRIGILLSTVGWLGALLLAGWLKVTS